MKVLSKIVFAVSFMFASMANANVILSLTPNTQDAAVGDLVSVSVMIDGLGDYGPLSVAEYYMEVLFDDTALSFAGVDFSDFLGGAADSDQWAGSIPGVVGIEEFSYLDSNTLWDTQPGSFALAELFFIAVKPVTSAILSIGYAEVYRVNGDGIEVIGVNDATVRVNAPAAVMLMGLGLSLMFFRKKTLFSNK